MPPPQLPSFLRRRLRLYEARRALLAGAPEEALDHLGDPALALSDGAARLRSRVLDLLCREAAKRAAAGEAAPARRLLERVADEDPERARLWRGRIEGERAARPDFELAPAAESGIRDALEGLLGAMRRERRERSDARPASVAPRAATSTGINGSGSREVKALGVRLFHLEVDDAGEFLVASGEELVLGHQTAGRADLGFLADLDPRHARIRSSESFHAGPGWTIAPVGSQRIEVASRVVPSEGARLADGELVRLSEHLAFVFRTPDAGSASALLELQHGAECEGAERVLLLRPGAAGAVRIAGRADRLVTARGLRHEVRLALEGGRLELSADVELRSSALEMASASALGEGHGSLAVDFPPARRIDFGLGVERGARPPFGFAIRPLDPRREGAP